MPCVPLAGLLGWKVELQLTHCHGHEPLNARQKVVEGLVQDVGCQMSRMVDLLVHVSLVVGLSRVDRVELIIQLFNVFLGLEAVRFDRLNDNLGVILERDDRCVFCRSPSVHKGAHDSRLTYVERPGPKPNLARPPPRLRMSVVVSTCPGSEMHDGYRTRTSCQ